MSLRNRLFALVSGIVALAVVLVTWTVSSSARRAFATLDAQRTSAVVAQVPRDLSDEAQRVATRLDRIAENDAFVRIAIDLGRPGADRAVHVDDAAQLAAASGFLDILDIVADDGSIVSSA